MRADIQGPFDLARQNEYFGGWTAMTGKAITMAFPVEGWTHSAAVTLRQRDDTTIEGEVVGEVTGGGARAWQQALAVLSLDSDGSGYAEVGERDPVIGALQREHAFLRPVLFHSPYEAACAFIIGHRLRIEQGRAIRQRMGRDFGQSFDVDGTIVSAFPTPQRLREITEVPGLSDEKITRLHGVAEAAMTGRLDRAHLRSLPVEEALAEVTTLRGVGDFFAVAIVMRGAGLVDATPNDPITRAGIAHFYGLDEPAPADVARITDGWRPYRMWCSVLVHASERRRSGRVA
jgi:DNA-3-methyladenine glycosylase II